MMELQGLNHKKSGSIKETVSFLVDERTSY